MTMNTQSNDLVSALMDYECGLLGADATLELFAELIRSGLAWQLQGSYGRAASALIAEGLISASGEVLA